MSDHANVPTTKPQFSLAALLRLVLLIALVFAAARLTGQTVVPSIVGGAIIGLFLAEYFATNRFREFICLVIIPDTFLTGGILSKLEVDLIFGAIPELVLLAAGCFLGGVIPSIIAVMLVIIAAAMVHQLTGYRLLKYEWNVSGGTN